MWVTYERVHMYECKEAALGFCGWQGVPDVRSSAIGGGDRAKSRVGRVGRVVVMYRQWANRQVIV